MMREHELELRITALLQENAQLEQRLINEQQRYEIVAEGYKQAGYDLERARELRDQAVKQAERFCAEAKALRERLAKLCCTL